MTEQEIDAEANLYEPYPSSSNPTLYSWWHEGPDPSDVPTDYFILLEHYHHAEVDVRYYLAREAAFLDLRQAIAAHHAAG